MATITRQRLWAALLATLLLPASAAAGDGAHGEGHHANVLALKGVFAPAWHSGERSDLGGVGLSYYRQLTPHWLFVEAGAKALFNEHATCIPLELLLRAQIHGGHHVHASVGLGALVEPVLHGGETTWAYGGTASLEGVWMVGRHLGLLLEGAYLLKDEHGVVHGVEAMAGVVLGF